MKEYQEYPLRSCRGKEKPKVCRECKEKITHGQTYYDGGKYRLCHYICAPLSMKEKK